LLAETLPSNQLEHSRGSRKRRTAGAPRCSIAGDAKQKEEHSRVAKCVELTGDEVLELKI
jgi:hypothetical protein